MSKPSIILVEPQMGANIGAAARAMCNFGLSDLRLVAPRDGWPNEEAERNGAGAFDQMDTVQVFDTLSDAIADLNFVLATTARRRDLVKDVYTPNKAALSIHGRASAAQKCSIVFGGERAGLTNDHIALCQGIINIPTNPDFSSLNLGQSVLLCAWEYFRVTNTAADKILEMGASPPADQKDLELFLKRLEDELEIADFFKSDGLKPTMIRNIRSIFARNDLTDQELRTLHGVLSALIK